MGARKIIMPVVIIILVFHTTATAGTYFFVTFQYPPLAYETADGKPDGVFVRMLTQIMEDLGHRVNIRVLPWTRALTMVRLGEADAIFTAYKNREREQFLDYPDQVLFPQAVYFYKRPSHEIEFNGEISGLSNRRIGVVSTISYGKKFDAAKSGLDIDKANRLEHNFTKLLLGRIDLVPSDRVVADNVIRQMGIEKKVERLPVQLDSVPSYIAFSKKRKLKSLMGRVDRELKQMKGSGEYYRLLDAAGIAPGREM